MENQNHTQTNTFKTTNNKLLAGLFRDRKSMEIVYTILHERGYTNDEIYMIMSNDTRKKHFADKETDIGNKAATGLVTGSAIGGSVGAVAGIVAAIAASIAIPGSGLLVTGPLAVGLAGAGVGGVSGGIIGALIGAGIPEDHARIYEDGIKDGNILLGIHPRNSEDVDCFTKKLEENDARDIYL